MPAVRCAVVDRDGVVVNVVVADPATYDPPDGCGVVVPLPGAEQGVVLGAIFDIKTGVFAMPPDKEPA